MTNNLRRSLSSLQRIIELIISQFTLCVLVHIQQKRPKAIVIQWYLPPVNVHGEL